MMLSPIFANVNTHVDTQSVGDGRIVGNTSMQTHASPQATGGTAFTSLMGFNYKNNPWQPTAANSDTSHTLSQHASVINPNTSTGVPWGTSTAKQFGGTVSGSGKYFDFNGSWGAVGAFGLGNFDNAGVSQQWASA
jgi:hypothetical protein